MTWRAWPATAAITAVTALVSAVLIAGGLLDHAAIGAGFIPARIGGAEMPPQLWAAPTWLTPLTSTLIHGGWAHVALNLVMLVFCGMQTERAIGSGPLVVLYVVGAYCAAAAQWLIDPGSVIPMVGASGAISAVLAAYALLYGKSRARTIGPFSPGFVHVVWLAAAWIGIQLLIGLAGLGGFGEIATAAHVGGFLAGLILCRPMLMWRYRRA